LLTIQPSQFCPGNDFGKCRHLFIVKQQHGRSDVSCPSKTVQHNNSPTSEIQKLFSLPLQPMGQQQAQTYSALKTSTSNAGIVPIKAATISQTTLSFQWESLQQQQPLLWHQVPVTAVAVSCLISQ
jgi:hypothetical protein